MTVDTTPTSSTTKQPSLGYWQAWFACYHWQVALILYTTLTVIITYPVIFHLGDSVIGASTDNDGIYFIWQNWWFRKAIESGQDPAYSNYIFALLPYPAEIF